MARGRSTRLRDLRTSDAGAALALRVHEEGGALHVFAASLQPEPLAVKLSVRGKTKGKAEIAGDDSPRALDGGTFRDDFAGYGFRRYRIAR